MNARGLFGLGLAACAAFVTSCAGRDGAHSDSELLLVSSRDSVYTIYAMDADGRRQARLSQDGGGGGVSSRQVFFQVEPAWSPDGRKIAFASRRKGTFDIFVMSAEGTGTRALTTTPDDDGHPTWSPDGTQLAFERGERGDIYVIDADGARLRRITRDPEQEIHPAWSPDGRWIAFVRRTPETRIAELWLVRPDGSRRHRLTSLRAGSLSPSWSPDGRRIAFSTNLGSTTSAIYTIGADGKGLRRVTLSGGDAFEPAWSPDGDTIAFSKGGSIVTIDQEGRERKLTKAANNDSYPAWKPRQARNGG